MRDTRERLRQIAANNSIMTETNAQAIARLEAALAIAVQEMTNSNNTITALRGRVTTLETAPAAPTSVQEFATNPYLGNINPSSSTGSKLWKDAVSVSSSADKLNPRIQNATEVISTFRAHATTYGWGPLINKIPITVNGVQLDKKILRDHKHIKVDDVRRATSGIFYQQHVLTGMNQVLPSIPPSNHSMNMFHINPATDPNHRVIFYNRVRANMIGLKIVNSLTAAALQNLESDKALYTWNDANGDVFYDGPVILQLIMEHIMPSTRVGVSDLKDKLKAVSMANFSHNPRDMLQHMKSVYEEIQEQGGTHEDYLLDVFRALKTAKNDDFLTLVKKQKTDWDTGTDIDVNVLAKQCVLHYNNLVKTKSWSETSAKEDKLIALSTELKELKHTLATYNKDGPAQKSTFQSRVPEWRLTKTLGDKVEKDGKQWHWCHKQHNDGKGMYVTHAPENHTEWAEKKKADKDAKKKGTTSDDKVKTLQPNEKLKAAMVAKFKCSDTEAAQLLTSLEQGN